MPTVRILPSEAWADDPRNVAVGDIVAFVTFATHGASDLAKGVVTSLDHPAVSIKVLPEELARLDQLQKKPYPLTVCRTPGEDCWKLLPEKPKTTKSHDSQTKKIVKQGLRIIRRKG